MKIFKTSLKSITVFAIGAAGLFAVATVLSVYGLQKEAATAVKNIRDDLGQDILTTSISSAERRMEVLRRSGHYGLSLAYGNENAGSGAKCISQNIFPIMVDGIEVGRVANCISSDDLPSLIAKSPLSIMTFGAMILVLLGALMVRFRIQRLQIVAQKNDEIAQLSYQVAHDIRSPLSALNTLLDGISGIPDSKKALLKHSVNRINDIANTLALKKVDTTLSGAGYLVVPEIDLILTEKRIERANTNGISISFQALGAMDALTCFDKADLKRIISNLLNNSIEAIVSAPDNKNGKIVVSLSVDGEFAKIKIQDNGPGLPKSFKSSDIGKKRISFGKSKMNGAGTGAGLFHAKTTIEKSGGEFSIENGLEGGVQVEINIPRIARPAWLTDRIEISPEEPFKLAILDDDRSIHSMWDNILQETKIAHPQLSVVHFYSSKEFELWNRLHLLNLLICDYELGAGDVDGMTVIRKNKLESKSILSTSHYGEAKIQNMALESGIKIVPKFLIPFLAIKSSASKAQNQNREIVLLDDDYLVRDNWELYADEKGASIKIFEKSSELLGRLNLFGPDTLFFIDNRLGKESGVEVARKIHEAGFKEIYLQTGDDKSLFSEIPFIREVVGKSPNW